MVDLPSNLILLNDLLVPSGRTPMDANFFNTRFNILGTKHNALATQLASFAQTEDRLVSEGLIRINEAMAPLLTQLQNSVELGFLVAQAVITPPAGGVSLATDQDVGWVITNPLNTSGASVFTPTVYLLATDDYDVTNWGIVKVVDWTPSTNNLAAHCLYCTQTKASLSWTLSCNNAILQVMMDLEAQVQAASVQVHADYLSVVAAVDIVNTALGAIAAGPVLSVCGYTGVVLLGIGDISGLAAALTNKASVAALNSAIVGLQPSSAILTNLSALSMAANQLVYPTGTSSWGTTSFTPYARSLLDDPDAAAAQTTLGISPFIQSLLDDTDQATARATLGAIGGSLATVASTGSYVDLSNKPVINNDAALPFVIDGGGAVITTGFKFYAEVPFNCVINRATLLAQVAGSIVVNIWRCTYSQFDGGTTHPVVGDKITGSTPPTISSAKKAQDTNLTGWTTTLAAGDILAIVVDSITTLQWVQLSLKVTKTA